jgi:AAA ATPase domain
MRRRPPETSLELALKVSPGDRRQPRTTRPPAVVVGSAGDLGRSRRPIHAPIEIDMAGLVSFTIVVVDRRFHGPGGRTGLRGRGSECALLEDLVSAIRRGESRSLVLRGEAGIGKTALLDYLIASASDLTVVRAVGVQSEMELPFASLHQLCGGLDPGRC